MVYVGDHIRDIESGNAAGCFTVAVKYGYIEDHESRALGSRRLCRFATSALPMDKESTVMPIAPSEWSPTANRVIGKTILVTGASEGIGRAASLAYAVWRGSALLSRNEERLEALYDEIVALGARACITSHGSSQSDPRRLVTLAGSLSEALPKLDGLLHNASLLGDRKPIAQTRAATWHDVMQVNVNAGFMLTQTLLPLSDQAPSASIVFTSSGVVEPVARTGEATPYRSLQRKA